MPGAATGSRSAWRTDAEPGKAFVALDLRTSGARHAMHDLVRRADVFVENFRPGTAERLGIGYDELARLNPRLVYASLSGFGDSGPLAGLGGYDFIAQAMSGIMSVTGEPDGEPTKTGPPVTDVAAGIYLAYGVLAALLARGRDGLGQRVDTSLLEAGLSFGIWEAAELWSTGDVPGRLGNVHRSFAPYQVIRAGGDTRFVLAANTDRMFEVLSEVLGAPELVSDERFVTNAARVDNRDALIATIENRTIAAPATRWVDDFNQQRHSCGAGTRLRRCAVPSANSHAWNRHRGGRRRPGCRPRHR